PVGDALQLTPLLAAEAEAVLDVHRPLRVVGQLLLRVLVLPQVVGVDAQIDVPLLALIDPVLVPLLVLTRLDEELHLHLLELAGAEDEIAGRDLVAEGLPDLPDPERRFLAGGGQHVGEVDEDALRGLRTQVVQTLLALHRTEVGLEHHVEFTRFSELATRAAVRTRDLGQVVLGDLLASALGVLLSELIGAEAVVAGSALHQRIVERVDVAGRHPHLPGQDDRRVQADDVVPALHHRLPPLALDVVLQLDAERSVVPRRPGTTVDLAGRVDETTALAKADDRVDQIGGHVNSGILHWVRRTSWSEHRLPLEIPSVPMPQHGPYARAPGNHPVRRQHN